MKNISPVSPLDEIVPEGSQSAVPVEPATAQAPEPLPDAAPSSKPAPVAPWDMPAEAASQPTAGTPPGPAAPQQLYPEAKDFEQRAADQAQAYNVPGSALTTPYSQYFIPLIVGVYALYTLYELIKVLFTTSVLGAFDLLSLIFGGNSLAGYLIFGFAIVQFIILLILSYKIFRGSKIALALLSGPLVLYLQYKLLIYLIVGSEFLSLGGAKSYVTLVAEIALAALIILAWTKEKQHYYK